MTGKFKLSECVKMPRTCQIPQIRCPLCGRWSWSGQIKKNASGIEARIAHYVGGRANKKFIQYFPVVDLHQLNEIRKFFARRCKELAIMLGEGFEPLHQKNLIVDYGFASDVARCHAGSVTEHCLKSDVEVILDGR